MPVGLFRYDWRITFVNLKNSTKRVNAVGPDERNKIWIPNLVFDNSPNDGYIKNDALSSLIVKKEGQTTLKLNQNLQENEESSGDSNPLEYARNYELELGCDFQLHNYPFDSQMCSIMVINSIELLG
jgi:hypothetical protein